MRAVSALLAALALSGCLATQDMRVRLPVAVEGDAVSLHSPLRHDPPFDGTATYAAFTYLCADGRVVHARYDGARFAELRVSGYTALLRGIPMPDRGRTTDADALGYVADDMRWHRHGSEAILIDGADSTPCILAGPGGASIVRAAPIRHRAVPLPGPAPVREYDLKAARYGG